MNKSLILGFLFGLGMFYAQLQIRAFDEVDFLREEGSKICWWLHLNAQGVGKLSLYEQDITVVRDLKLDASRLNALGNAIEALKLSTSLYPVSNGAVGRTIFCIRKKTEEEVVPIADDLPMPWSGLRELAGSLCAEAILFNEALPSNDVPAQTGRQVADKLLRTKEVISEADSVSVEAIVGRYIYPSAQDTMVTLELFVDGTVNQMLYSPRGMDAEIIKGHWEMRDHKLYLMGLNNWRITEDRSLELIRDSSFSWVPMSNVRTGEFVGLLGGAVLPEHDSVGTLQRRELGHDLLTRLGSSDRFDHNVFWLYRELYRNGQ